LVIKIKKRTGIGIMKIVLTSDLKGRGVFRSNIQEPKSSQNHLTPQIITSLENPC